MFILGSLESAYFLLYSTLFVDNDSRTIIEKKNKNNINQSKQLTN